MTDNFYKYIIIGGGLAGASAIEGIREKDPKNEILLISAEEDLPYHRPPLSKGLWTAKKKLEDIFVYKGEFYGEKKVRLKLGFPAVSINRQRKEVALADKQVYRYEKLLIATGGAPRKLSIPGGDYAGLYYYRVLKDYSRMKAEAQRGKSAVIIGGGFIGSEVAAALNVNGLKVTMIFPDAYICSKIFPDYLGKAMQEHYLEKGIKILKGDRPVSIERGAHKFLTTTQQGENVESDLVVIGVGITPEVSLAEAAGLKVGNGITVNEYLQTSDPDIYAAGDNAEFFYKELGKALRLEHWDNALNQGKLAGENMAGTARPYTYLAYFFSDLFDFGYEAVGEIDSRFETFADWQEENKKGVIYYLKDGKVRGVMMCDVWDKVALARKLVLEGKNAGKETLKGMIS